MSFSAFLKERRMKTGLTLRSFCQKHGFDAGNLSRMERGLYVPGDDALEPFARALGLKRGSQDWQDFFDRAAAARGEIPKDLLSDAEVVSRLPVLFRTLRGDPFPSQKLDELIDKIRRA